MIGYFIDFNDDDAFIITIDTSCYRYVSYGYYSTDNFRVINIETFYANDMTSNFIIGHQYEQHCTFLSSKVEAQSRYLVRVYADNSETIKKRLKSYSFVVKIARAHQNDLGIEFMIIGGIIEGVSSKNISRYMSALKVWLHYSEKDRGLFYINGQLYKINKK